MFRFWWPMRKLCRLPTTASILLFPRLALARFQIRLAPFERWRAFVEQAVRSCCWSMAEAIANGLDVGRTAMQIGLPNPLPVTGTANRWSLRERLAWKLSKRSEPSSEFSIRSKRNWGRPDLYRLESIL